MTRPTNVQQLLDIGEGHGDAWANDVALRMAGITDLPTADLCTVSSASL